MVKGDRMKIELDYLENIEEHELSTLNNIIVGYLKKKKANGVVYLHYKFKDGRQLSNVQVIE